MDLGKKREYQGQTLPEFLKKDIFGRCKSFPPSPRSVTITFDINSEPAFFSKPLAGGQEPLLTHKGLSGLREDHRTLRRMNLIFLKRQGQKIKNGLKNQSLLSIKQKKELEMTPSLEKEGPGTSTAPKKLQNSLKKSATNLIKNRQVLRKIKARAKAEPISTDSTHKATGFPNWNLQP
ncbi:hypothetical protein O181_077711 [Austropuccinia psidii MF-1]|uniref:Uncharacterized protein n=1 Tax=Austropuccinia psidii MF-1 TaxID=1389203 RepID=A0A9Q3FIK7_9BASI|nr:hypothetical protein [Austropuccinia psidii MF-1]